MESFSSCTSSCTSGSSAHVVAIAGQECGNTQEFCAAIASHAQRRKMVVPIMSGGRKAEPNSAGAMV